MKTESSKNISLNPLIVIVDDDEAIRDSIQSLTRSVGFKTEAFTSAEQFLSSDLVDQTSCLILDVRMQGMSGLQLQERLNEMDSKVPIVFVTAHYNEEIREAALQAGAIEVLSKPFSEAALLNSIDIAVKKSKDSHL